LKVILREESEKNVMKAIKRQRETKKHRDQHKVKETKRHRDRY
jgi:hypothetical protein